jgi:hypothetical protein
VKQQTAFESIASKEELKEETKSLEEKLRPTNIT